MKNLFLFLMFALVMIGNSQDVQSVNSPVWVYRIMGATSADSILFIPTQPDTNKCCTTWIVDPPYTALSRIYMSAGNGYLFNGNKSNKLAYANGTSSQYIKGDGTFGTYTGVTTPTYNYTSRTLSTTGSNNTFTISATNAARVNYTISFAVNLTLLPPLTSNAVVQLDYSTNGGSTWQPVSSVSQVYGVAVTLSNTTQNNLSGEVPVGALVRIYNSTNSNTTTTIVKTQEVIY